MLNAYEQRILEAIQNGHQFIYKISIETGFTNKTISKHVNALVEKGHVRKGGMGNNYLIPLTTAGEPKTKRDFIIRYYGQLSRREMAARLGMAKTDLNMMLIELGLGQ